jgi:hypothetical protein
MKCGKKMGNVRPDLENVYLCWLLSDTDQYVFIGFSHAVCSGGNGDTEKERVDSR